MKVPYHIPSLPKPQLQYNIEVDNSNRPFAHPWLPRRGSEPVHPASPFLPTDFVLTTTKPACPVEPPPSIESTPFALIESVEGLRALAGKLSESSEFAVDLEHNAYRSYLGITCLMQVSTRKEDFVVDTLKLREHIRPCLGEFFGDPTKTKIMHGASKDILWLQRDFGIYVCNLFDTMQASQVMKLERNSLDFLLEKFCGVIANKEYQASDWRIRPLPYEMVKYAREDTHYLFYVRDLMLNGLGDGELAEVSRRSYDVCVQMYEKEVFRRSTSYLYLYGLSEANLNAKQLKAVVGLNEWRDTTAREEDESTGYILPNKFLLEIAKTLPWNKNELLDITGYDKEHLVKYDDILVRVIWDAIYDDYETSLFEKVVALLDRKVDVSTIAQAISLGQKRREEDRNNIRRRNCLLSYQHGLIRPNCVYFPIPVSPHYAMY